MKFRAGLFWVSLCCCGEILAAQEAGVALPGRLFYTPQQRAQLQDARRRNQTVIRPAATTVPAPVSFDGLVLRSDGATTHWINGRARRGAPPASLRSLKPGQIRADHRVYEPYQVLRPADSASAIPHAQEATP